jgi:hypothetical protein
MRFSVPYSVKNVHQTNKRKKEWLDSIVIAELNWERCAVLFRFSFYSSSSQFNTQYKEKAALGGSAVSLSLLRHSRPEERETREVRERYTNRAAEFGGGSESAELASWIQRRDSSPCPSRSVCVCYSFWKYIANAPIWWYLCVCLVRVCCCCVFVSSSYYT